jgi:hypothetical protein
LFAHGRWFSLDTPASSTTKTGQHDIAEILLKVPLNTKNVDTVNKEVDRSKYQQTDANEDSGVDTQSQQDKNTVDSLLIEPNWV